VVRRQAGRTDQLEQLGASATLRRLRAMAPESSIQFASDTLYRIDTLHPPRSVAGSGRRTPLADSASPTGTYATSLSSPSVATTARTQVTPAVARRTLNPDDGDPVAHVPPPSPPPAAKAKAPRVLEPQAFTIERPADDAQAGLATARTLGGTPRPHDGALAKELVAALQARQLLPRLMRLVVDGADIEATDAEGNTAVFLAAKKDNVAALSFLVEKGANVQLRNGNNRTLLQEAMLSNAPHAFRWLLERSGPDGPRRPGGEHLNAEGRNWWRTTLFLAVAEVVDVATYILPLLAAGADPMCTNEAGQTVLEYAVLRDYNHVLQAVLQWQPALVNRPLPRSPFKTLLNVAIAANKSAALVRTLLDAGADPALTDKDGYNALELAVVHGNDGGRLLCLLLDHPPSRALARTPSPGGWWRTALHLAARHDRPLTARLLVHAGAFINAEDTLGRTPLVLAALHSAQATFEALCQLPDLDVNHVALSTPWRGPVHALIHFQALDMLSALVRLPGLDWSIRDAAGRTAVEYAIVENAVDAVEVVVPARVPATYAAPETGRTLLHVAVEHDRPVIVLYLVLHGADPNARDCRGLTPRQMAQQASRTACLEALNGPGH